MVVEKAELISGEKDSVNTELEFFGFDGERIPAKKFGYVGTHTLEPYSSVNASYPIVLLGISQIYSYLDATNFSVPEQNDFLQTYLGNALRNGDLVSNDEVKKIKDAIGDGEHALQYQGFINGTNESVEDRARKMNYIFEAEDDDMTDRIFNRRKRINDLYGKYTLIHSDTGIAHNKRIVNGWFGHIQRGLGIYYGEVDFSKALVAEMILDAPFLEAASMGKKTEGAEEGYKAYINQAVAFASKFNPTERMRIFEELTSSIDSEFVKEESISVPTKGDQAYLLEVYQFATDALAGKPWDIKDLLSIYRHSILTRNKFFKASVAEDEKGKTKTQLLPVEIPLVSFDQIGGYEQQKGFYQNLLAKLAENDTRIKDISLIIAAGEPGLGKSLGVKAFLSSLPDNAKGIIFEAARVITSRGKLPQYELVTKLTSLHPELEIFVVLEDMDTLAGERSSNPFAHQFLEVDSAVPDSLPENMHIIGTTNRLDKIDRAITRPGRASKILLYEPAKDPKERMAIVEIHEKSENYPLSDALKKHIVDKATGFTGDEIHHIIWSLAFDGVKDPTTADIDRVISEIRQKHKMVKDSIGFQTNRES